MDKDPLTNFTPGFLKLPDELLLEILSYLPLIKDLGQHARDSYDGEEENQLRLETLNAICCTCKHLRRVAEPLLYSALFLYPGKVGRRLACYARTILTTPTLRNHLKFVYATLSDDCGPEFECLHATPEGDTADYWLAFTTAADFDELSALATEEANNIWSKEQISRLNWELNPENNFECALLALVLSQKSVEQIAVLSSCDNTVVDMLLGLSTTPPGVTYYPTPSFENIYQLSIARCASHYLKKAYFDCSTQRFPSLKSMKLYGPIDLQGSTTKVSMSLESLQLLERIAFQPWYIPTYFVIRHMVCGVLSFEVPGDSTFGKLHDHLLAQSDCLESLSLNISTYGTGLNDDSSAPFRRVGNLTSLRMLRSLRISAFLLLGAPLGVCSIGDRERGIWWDKNSPSFSISEMLPESLEQFTLADDFGLSENAVVLKDFANESWRLPALRSVRLLRNSGNFDSLTAQFAIHGISFTSHFDPTDPDHEPEIGISH